MTKPIKAKSGFLHISDLRTTCDYCGKVLKRASFQLISASHRHGHTILVPVAGICEICYLRNVLRFKVLPQDISTSTEQKREQGNKKDWG